MKTRNGLVSNSSTTSYIIELNDSVKCTCCKRTDPNLYEILECIEIRDNSGDYKIFSSGNFVSAIDQWLSGDDYFDSEEKNKVTKQLEKIPEDKRVLYFQISHHCDWLINIINSIIESGSGKLIWKSE